MQKALLFWFVFLPVISIHAQELIPWLGANGKYGYATEHGRIVVRPEYDELDPIPDAQLWASGNYKGKQCRVTRNGIRIPLNAYFSPTLNFIGADNEKQVDTLRWPVLFVSTDTLYTCFATAKTARKCSLKAPYNSLAGFNVPIVQKDRNIRNFSNGFMKIVVAPDSINFVDTSGRIVFKKNLRDGVNIDKDYFIVALDNGQMGIRHKNDYLLPGSIWSQIIPTPQSGFFIVRSQTGKMGLLNHKGQLTVDTMFSRISVSGTSILISEVNYLTQEILKYNGQSLFQTSSNIKYMASPANDCIITFDTKSQRYGLVDLNGRAVSDSTFQTVEYLSKQDSFSLFLIQNNAGKYGVLNLDNQLIIPAQFDKISPTFLKNTFQVTKGDLTGMTGATGRTIVPCRYKQINRDSYKEIIWAQSPHDELWTAYSFEGDSLAYPSFCSPFLGPQDLASGGIYGEYICIEGSKKVKRPPGLNSCAPYTSIKTSDDIFIIFSKDRSTQLFAYNSQLKNIMPKGFGLCEALFESVVFKNTGLLAVYQFPNSISDTALFFQTPFKPENNQGPREFFMGWEVDRFISKAPAFTACGVINVKGEWVVPPTKNVWYFPLTPYLVVEIPYPIKLTCDQSGEAYFKLIRVNQPNITSSITSSCFYKTLIYPGNSLLIGKFIKEKQAIRYAYFDDKGNQITPYEFVDGGQNRSRLIATKEDAGGKQFIVILDHAARELARIEGYEPDKESAQYPPYDYFYLQKMNTTNRMLFDSTGTKLLSKDFPFLKIEKKLQYLSCQKSAQTITLMDWQANEVATLDGAMLFFKTMQDHTLWALTFNEAVHLDPNNNILHRITTDGDFARSPLDISLADKYINYRHNSKLVWVNGLNGMQFKE
jgi:hypothetical protein